MIYSSTFNNLSLIKKHHYKVNYSKCTGPNLDQNFPVGFVFTRHKYRKHLKNTNLIHILGFNMVACTFLSPSKVNMQGIESRNVNIKTEQINVKNVINLLAVKYP